MIDLLIILILTSLSVLLIGAGLTMIECADEWQAKHRINRRIRDIQKRLIQASGDEREDLQLMLWLCERSKELL
jgi:hypothetical protein